jgi:hypothetical protein
MTNYDFACCDLTNTTFRENLRKKFKELVYGDNVYCISIIRGRNVIPTNTLYVYKYKNAMMDNPDNTNPKRRKAIFYLTDSEPYIGFKADIHKSGSIISDVVKKREREVYIRIYATSKEECIERAEKIFGQPVTDRLVTQEIY